MNRILIIDDDTSVRASIMTSLEQEGFNVVAVDDGRAGLAALESATFDLVVVDIFMPGMDGLETITALRQRAPLVPIIATSSFMFRDSATPAPDFLAMATKLGAAYSLHKPFRAGELIGAVQACLRPSLPETHSAAS